MRYCVDFALANRLDKMGVIHALRGRRDLDEAAGAYKDISE